MLWTQAEWKLRNKSNSLSGRWPALQRQENRNKGFRAEGNLRQRLNSMKEGGSDIYLQNKNLNHWVLFDCYQPINHNFTMYGNAV